MNAPPLRATYRLQFREGMDFERAAGLAPYLARLGVSHLYASPVFAAAPGSTHGYDVADHGAIEPALGGREGFERLVAALRAQGLGLILDIVPNHMAAHVANPWWASVLRWGRDSPFLRHFDVDWTADRLLLPTLARPYHEALAGGAVAVIRDGAAFAVEAGGQRLPLHPRGPALALAPLGAEAAEAARVCAAAEPGADAAVADALAALGPVALERAAGAVTADREALHALLETQPWRLAWWRLGREALTYRRFFTVDGLVGVRVELPEVFEDVHRLLFELVGGGLVDGVRVDHVDGLADPAAYLRRLRDRLGPDRPVWVEKILHLGETLPGDWPVAGTTGYEAIAEAADVFVDPAGEAGLTRAWAEATGGAPEVAALVAEAKRRVLTHDLAAELEALADAALALAGARIETRDLGRDGLRRAIVAMVEACPVYRCYVDLGGAGPRDRALVAGMADAARASRDVEAVEAVDFVARLLTLDLPDAEGQAAALAFARRFQQTTGPVAAKGVEDTVFYRHGRLLGLNEVGGAPERFGAPFAEVHARLAARAADWPLGLTAGTTHDTKRGEDARARLYALSLAPGRWAAGVARWGAALAGGWGEAERRGDVEWSAFQALLGVWPEATPDAAALGALARRLDGWLVKALREAKADTSWTQVDAAFEAAARRWLRRSLDPADAAGFLADFAETAAPFVAAGRIVSLGQTALRLLGPGVPDVYQGSEAGDFSLVDPDNRRPPDFAALARALDAPSDAPSGAPFPDAKLRLTAALLRLRRTAPSGFLCGDCRPVDAGPDAFAFLRTDGDVAALVVAPARRAVAGMAGLGDAPAPDRLLLRGVGGAWVEAVTGESRVAGAEGLVLPMRPAPWVLLRPGASAAFV